LRNLRPIFFENSKIPVWLSKVAPLEIGAICVGPLVFARGEVTDISRRHETIHFQQTLETLVIGMILFYLFDFIRGLWKYRNSWLGSNNQRGHPYQSAGNKAYHQIRAEQEAYANERSPDYLSTTRRRYRWLFDYKV
jgi:hypothetical protein